MKKTLTCMAFAACLSIVSVAKADINVSIDMNGMPNVNISTNTSVVLMPDTPDVYFVPDSNDDVFFWNGMWWHSWQGKWFKSENNNSGWQPCNRAPEFSSKVNPHWRQNYKEGKWNGKPWSYKKVPYGQMKKEQRHEKGNPKDRGNGKDKGHKKNW